MTPSQLIDALGGTAKVAEAFGRKYNSVSNWRVRGIPWRYRVEIAAMAKRARVAVPEGFLGRGGV